MRGQRRAGVTVTLIRMTTAEDTDDIGDAADSTPQRTTIRGAVFEPQLVLERTGTDQVPVVRPGAWNLPGVYDIDSDDVIEGPDGAKWYVVGGGNVWSDRTKVAVERTRSV